MYPVVLFSLLRRVFYISEEPLLLCIASHFHQLCFAVKILNALPSATFTTATACIRVMFSNCAFRVNHALFVSQCFNCIGDAPQMFPSLQTLGKETADFYCDSLFFFLFFCFFFFCFLCLLLLLLFMLFLCFLLLIVLVIVVLVMAFIPVVAVGDVLHVLSLV